MKYYGDILRFFKTDFKPLKHTSSAKKCTVVWN